MHSKKHHSPLCKVTRKYELRIKRIGTLLLESYVPIESSQGIPYDRLPADLKKVTSSKLSKLFPDLS